MTTGGQVARRWIDNLGGEGASDRRKSSPAAETGGDDAFAAHADEFWEALEREFIEAVDEYNEGPGVASPVTCDVDPDDIHVKGQQGESLRVEFDRAHRCLLVSNPPVTGGQRVPLKASALGMTATYGEGPVKIAEQILSRWLRQRG
jgi:hypothetical protein